MTTYEMQVPNCPQCGAPIVLRSNSSNLPWEMRLAMRISAWRKRTKHHGVPKVGEGHTQ